MGLETVISIIFFITFVIYSAFSIYVLNLNYKYRVNRLFFLVCLLYSLWSFSFSIANSATDYETALFWRRVASIGWGTVYSFMLHFILELTDNRRVLKKKWIHAVIYLPALANILIFSFLDDIASNQYNLVHTAAGWTNIQINNGYDWFFNFYYVSFSLSVITILVFWGRNSHNPIILKQRKLLIGSMAAAIIIGTITDIAANSFLENAVPQMAPVILLIHVYAIFHSIKKYGLMTPMTVNTDNQVGRILDNINRIRLFKILSVLLTAGGMINFMTEYFLDGKDLYKTMIFSGALFSGSLVIQFTSGLKTRIENQNIIIGLTMIASITALIFKHIEHASVSAWTASFLLIIISVVFSRKETILLLGAILVAIQIFVWKEAQNLVIVIDTTDYIVRILTICLAIWVSLFINGLYTKKLKENEKQIIFQRMELKISSVLESITDVNMNERIYTVLKLIGEYEELDCVTFSTLDNDYGSLYSPNIWKANNIEKTFDTSDHYSYPWTITEILKQNIILIPNVDNLRTKKGIDEKSLLKIGIKSICCIPIVNKDKTLGVLILQSIRRKNWGKDCKKRFRIEANHLLNVIVHAEAEKEINYLAYHDALTGLPNRFYFRDLLEKSISLSSRNRTPLAVIFLDLDSFKSVNDTLGHKGGDELLKEVANLLSGSIRKSDTVSRFGGDEFLIMIPQITNLENIDKLIQKIMKVFENPIRIFDHEFNITASLGISIYPIDGEDVETLIKNADMAMYNSKSKNKNQYTICSPELKEDILMRMKLTDCLYRAIENNELDVHYQPQVNALTDEIIGMEALVRWKHPELGMISPGLFIPIAERTGLISSIGQWVLTSACKQNKKWQEQGLQTIPMSVNLSVEQFKTLKLSQAVKETLESTGLEPEYLELEITENIAIDESMDVVGVLEELKAIGVRIAIDDFGIEYSSLSRLKALPIDRIKIDMQFVRGISKNEKDESIIEVIIYLAKRLGLSIIAEGVETEEQLYYLKEKGCNNVQGYYYYRPMNVKDATILLEEKKAFVKMKSGDKVTLKNLRLGEN